LNVISKRGLAELLNGKSREVADEALRWFKVAQSAHWNSLPDVREVFPDADQIGHVLVFNIRHNRYRLIVTEAFGQQRLYVKALLNHKEYERGGWKKWA
jgi:mRNA interferase HigB